MTRYTIAFVDDKRVNRNDFEQKIRMTGELELLFSFSGGHEFLETLKTRPVNKLPQIVFMDLEMPEIDGIETIRIAKSLYPHIFFIALTVFDDDDRIFEAIRAGASGYLLKHEPASVLKEAVQSVMEYGGAPMSPAIARKALQMLSKSVLSPVQESADLPDHVTEREKEVLQLLVRGWDAKRIALTLDISVLTVRTHIANIYQKLHIGSRAEAIRLAHQQKWFGE